MVPDFVEDEEGRERRRLKSSHSEFFFSMHACVQMAPEALPFCRQWGQFMENLAEEESFERAQILTLEGLEVLK